MKLLFCSSDIIPVICPFRDTTPKVCCCTCPLKWECHIKQKEIAEAKKEDLNANDIEAAMEIIKGTARSMGIEVEE